MSRKHFNACAPVPRTPRMAFVAVAAALTIGVTLAPTALGATKASPKIVGQVVAVGGTKSLVARNPATGKLHQLRVREVLTLGEELVMGAGVTATLRVSRPKGVSADVDLIDLKPVRGTPHRVFVTREGAYTIVKIVPG